MSSGPQVNDRSLSAPWRRDCCSWSAISCPLLIWALVGLIHWCSSSDTEPFRNNDETRHVMTGVFVRDALYDLPGSARDPKGYAVRYYAQYPALGLLMWPPLFYGVEGSAMAVFGPDYRVARGVLAGFGLLAVVYAYGLARLRFGRDVAAVAVATLAVSWLVFDHSRYVLLELPTLAWVLASVFHFERHLDERRSRDAILACLFAASAALTRFDGVMLLAYFGLRLVFSGNLRLLVRRPVVLGILIAAGLAGPYYLLTYREYSAGLSGAAVGGTNPTTSTGFLHSANFWLYPSFLPEQVGWAALVAAVGGLVVAVRRGQAGQPLALIAATYLTFVPLAEPEARHAIYWVPAVCTFAAVAVCWVRERFGSPAGLVSVIALVVATGGDALWKQGVYLHGYKPVAEYAAATTSGDRPVLFDGILNGDFIYQLRLADPARRLWVVRGDKLLYATLSDPGTRYTEFAATDAEVLAALHRVDPELIVVETPPLEHVATPPPMPPAAARLRRVLEMHPDRFRLEGIGTLNSNHEFYVRTKLLVYRKLDRNPDAVRTIEIPVLGTGKTLGATR